MRDRPWPSALRASQPASSDPAAEDVPHHQSKRVELDLVALAAQGFLMPDTPRPQTGDQYRVIKRP